MYFGNENEYKSYTLLNQYKLILNPNSTDTYTIEWKWEDTEYDTQIGKLDNAYYKMYIKVEAEQKVD